MAFQSGAFQSDAFQVDAHSFTIDAVLRREQVGSFTVDAVLRAAQTGAFTVDAVINAVVLVFTIDAVLRREQSATLTADAVLRAERIGSFTADAWLRPVGSFTVDAVLRRTRSFTFTANAIKRKTSTKTFTANAVLRRSQAASFTADAYIIFQRVFGSFTADSIVKAPRGGSFALRAFIRNDEADVAEATGVTQVHIRVNGADITDDVIFSDASFTTFVNGQVGTFRFRVKDTDRTRSFTTGDEVTLDIDGVRRFGGFVASPARSFFFPVEDTSDITRVARQLVFVGVDYNVLFDKRVVYDKDRPANVALRSWPEDTEDRTIIKYVVDHYTDLYDDGITHDAVEHVGFPNPDHRGVVGSGGLKLGDIMREVNRLIGAVWYISPSKELTWTDVDTPNASKSLSDHPAGGTEIGFRDFSHVSNGTKLANDAFVWGSAQGSRRLVFAREQDAASIAAHGRWQYGEYTAQMYKQASVDLRAETVVYGTPQNKRGGKDDAISWMATTYDPAFVIGQKVTIESEVFGVSDVVPIRKMTITFPTKTSPKFEMVISHEIDEPWNTFEFIFPRFNFDIPEIDWIDFGFPECGITDAWERDIAMDGGWGFSDVGLGWGFSGDPGAAVTGLGVIDGKGVMRGELDSDLGVFGDIPVFEEMEIYFNFVTPTSLAEPAPSLDTTSTTSFRTLTLSVDFRSAAENDIIFTWLIKRYFAVPPETENSFETDSLLRVRLDNGASASGSTWEEGTYLFQRFIEGTKYHVRLLCTRSKGYLRYWTDGFPEPVAWTITSHGEGGTWQSEDGVHTPDPIEAPTDEPDDDFGTRFRLSWNSFRSYVTQPPTVNHHDTLENVDGRDDIKLDDLSIWLDGVLYNACYGF